MTRPELVLILSDLIRRKAVTFDDAQAVLAAFDSGNLTDLPLPAPTEDDNRWVIALALLLLLLGVKTVGTLPAAKRTRAQELLQVQYEAQVGILAATVASGGTVAEWQAGMQSAIASYTRQMAIAGAGTLPKLAVRATVDEQLRGQWSYLAAFAVTLVAGKIADKMMSEAAIRSRAALYGAVAIGAYWRGSEPTASFGQIVYYDAQDTEVTCTRCSEAQRNSPYLAGSDHPFPGSVCLGRSRCKCRLRYEYNPAVYVQLTGRKAA